MTNRMCGNGHRLADDSAFCPTCGLAAPESLVVVSRRKGGVVWGVVLALALAIVLTVGLVHNSSQNSKIHNLSLTVGDQRATIKSQQSSIAGLQADQSLQSSAVQAAKTYGVWLSSYNYQDLWGPNSDWALVEDHADSVFKADFGQTSGNLANLLTTYNADATGRVIAEGVESINTAKAVVVVLIDQSVTNTTNKSSPVSQPLRVVITMVRQQNQWLIDSLELPS